MKRIIAVVAEQDKESAMEEIILASKNADMVEIREQTILAYENKLERLVWACKHYGISALYTLRSKGECGTFDGSRRERKRILQRLIDLGAPYVDNEHVMHVPLDKKKSRTVVSYHNDSETPEDLAGLCREMVSREDADVIKIIPTARTRRDAQRIIGLYRLKGIDPHNLIAFSMATNERDQLSVELARDTRVFAYEHGFGTFVVLDPAKAVVPGQLSYGELMRLTRRH